MESSVIKFEVDLGEPYDLELEPMRSLMIEKIEKNIVQFGSLERWHETFQSELLEKRVEAERAVKIWWMREKQMQFLEKWMRDNSSLKVKGLDDL